VKGVYLFFLLVSLVLGPLAPANSQEGSVSRSEPLNLEAKMVRHWNVFSGLPSDSITALYQDAKGYLWIGTFDSILRYDGNSFDTYDGRQTPGLLLHSASVFLETEDRLWIGSVNEGLAVFQDQTFTTFTRDEGLLSDSIMSLEYDSSGRLWVGTSLGLQTGPDSDFALPEYSVADPFARQGVPALLSHDDWGLIAAAQQGGIYLHADTHPTLVPGSADLFVRDITRWADGTILAGTSTGMVFELSPDGLREIPAFRVSGGSVRDLFYNSSTGRLWVASDSSLAYFRTDGTGRSVEEPEEVFSHTLKKVLEDSDGNLWLGTRSGGLFALADSRFTERVTVAPGDDAAVNSVAVDDAGGLWVASDRGLHYFKDERRIENRLTEFLDGVRVKHVLAHDGELYVSTLSPYGLLYTEEQEIRFLNEDRGIPSNIIKMSLIDSRGTLWISTAKGLVRRADGELTVFNRDSGFIADELYQIREDSTGALWVCTVHQGLVRLDRNGAYRRYGPEEGLRGNMVFSCYEDLQGQYWISTTEGVFLLDRTGRIHSLDYAKGLPYLYAYNAFPAGDTLVISSVNGVATTSIESASMAATGEIPVARMHQWGIADGLSGSPNALSWPTYHENGLWIPTHRGADYFPLDDIQIHQPDAAHRPATVHLDRITVDGEPYPGSMIQYETRDRVTRLEFHYSYPSLSDGHRLVFSSRLLGYQDEWSAPTTRRSTVYTNVGGGHYTFQVRAARVAGRPREESTIPWNESVSFPFQIESRLAVLKQILYSIAFLCLGGVLVINLILIRQGTRPRLFKPKPRTFAEQTPEAVSLQDAMKALQEEYALTEREAEFLLLLARGMRDKEIAKELGCAVSTVSNSFSRIYKKTGAKGRTELVALLHR
jgi:ligand-binding sensor domain-containing protein/DNA-binding CsgD family transcriptional regulator